MATKGEGDVVARIGRTGFTTEIDAGAHRLYADEPVSSGGADGGPSPYKYLSAALASCTAMTLRMYADRKGWPLEAVTARVSYAKVHAKDCADCETRVGLIDRFERVITLTGALDAEQRQRLLEIADRCPVHRTLTAEIRIDTTLAA
jgi:putative redox protein